MSDQGSAGDTSTSTELKAGHAPAIKVGGMRVGASRPRQTSQGDDKEKNLSSEETGEDNTNATDKEGHAGNNNQRGGDYDEDGQGSGSVANRVAGQMVSGTFVPIQKAFPTEAAKHIHEKPGTHPKNEFQHHPRHDDQRYINQPRKQ